MRIFVVDDDRDLAESLAEVLELSGHEVQIAHSGEEAVEIFRTQDFDVSFMDVVMPGMNGVESFLEIRKIKPDAKVFMLTGYSVTQLLEQAMENGALGVLEKPIGVEDLLQRIEGMEPEQEGMVLVADDDPAFRESLVEVLKQRGYNVCVASTGEQAVERVMAGGIDVLALDLRLPLLSGLDVYLELKRRGKTLPTVIMSGHLNEESEAVSALCDMSVTGILTKPFDPSHLLAALDRIGPPASPGVAPVEPAAAPVEPVAAAVPPPAPVVPLATVVPPATVVPDAAAAPANGPSVSTAQPQPAPRAAVAAAVQPSNGDAVAALRGRAATDPSLSAVAPMAPQAPAPAPAAEPPLPPAPTYRPPEGD